MSEHHSNIDLSNESASKVQDAIKRRGQRVVKLRKKLIGASRLDFCDGFKWSAQSLKAWELGWGGGLSEARAQDLAQHIKDKYGIYITIPWLMHGIGIPPSLVTKELDISKEEHIAKELSVFKELDGSIDAIVDDDGMAPILYPGDLVGGILKTDFASAIGKQCIVIDDIGQIHIRFLEKGDAKNLYHLVCCNEKTSLPKKKTNIAIQAVATIEWIRRRS